MIWLLLVAAAQAKKPAPAPSPAPSPAAIASSEAADWLKGVLPQVQAALAPVRSQVAGLLLEPDLARAEQRRLQLVTAANDAGARLDALSAFPNDDRVRQAARAFTARVAAECEGDLKRWVELRQPIVADADLAEAAALGAAAEQRLREADDAYFAAVDAFGADHNVRLTVARPAAVPEYSRDGLVPAGSSAPPRLVVQLAVAYAAQLQPMQQALVESYGTWRQKVVEWVPLNSPKLNPAAEAHAASRDTAGRAAAAIGRIGPWLGDPGLQAASKGLADAVIAMLDGPGAEVTKKSMAGVQSQREVEALNATLTDGDARVEAAMAAWDEAVVAFRARWAVDDYEEWLKSAAAR